MSSKWAGGAILRVDAELLILPFASAEGNSLLNLLVTEFQGDAWTSFHGAVGFAKTSGGFPALLDALHEFGNREGNSISLTFGADLFGQRTRGSDYDAVAAVLDSLEGLPNASVHLYHERGRTFHPKLYLFANEGAQRALVIVGSSNWSEGGLVTNVEANVVLRLQLDDEEHMAAYCSVVSLFESHWMETEDA